MYPSNHITVAAGGAHISWGGGRGGWAWRARHAPVGRRAEQVVTGPSPTSPPAVLVDIFAGKNESVILCGLGIKNE